MADSRSNLPPRVLITAGPTHEPIDAVRYIGNRSSGRLGLALAAATVSRGWPATLLLGPTALEPHQHSLLRVSRFQTTADLQALLARHFRRCDVLIMAAAVADFRPVRPPRGARTGKLRRQAHRLNVELEPTPDLVANLALTRREGQVIIGFALEHGSAPERLKKARAKLRGKRLDAIVANPLKTMDAPTISATLITAAAAIKPAGKAIPKAAFARWLLDQATQLARPRRIGRRIARAAGS